MKSAPFFLASLLLVAGCAGPMAVEYRDPPPRDSVQQQLEDRMLEQRIRERAQRDG